jgi:hypothetical protein
MKMAQITKGTDKKEELQQIPVKYRGWLRNILKTYIPINRKSRRNV